MKLLEIFEYTLTLLSLKFMFNIFIQIDIIEDYKKLSVERLQSFLKLYALSSMEYQSLVMFTYE